MKHKNYEYIVAFAEGKEVEYLDPMLRHGWNKVYEIGAFNIDFFKFRIKPEVKKTVGYRQFYNYAEDGVTIHLHTLQQDSVIYSVTVENLPRFIGWKHKEWQYDDVETN